MIPPTLLRTKASDISPAPTLHPRALCPGESSPHQSALSHLLRTCKRKTKDVSPARVSPRLHVPSSPSIPTLPPLSSSCLHVLSSLLIVSPRPLLYLHRISTSPPLSSSCLHVPSSLFIVSPRHPLSLYRVLSTGLPPCLRGVLLPRVPRRRPPHRHPFNIHVRA